MGIPSETTIQTLLGYAYMQPHVKGATIEFFPGSEDSQVRPSVTFKVELETKAANRHSSILRAQSSGGIFNKLKILALVKLGAPIPGMIEKNIEALSKQYLPPSYQVHVYVN